MAANIPVYLFTGFLEGGKTHIIQESMEDKRFGGLVDGPLNQRSGNLDNV